MTIYLVRHGKARKGGKDRLRPLTSRGIDETRLIAQFLRPLRLRPRSLWHSDRVRAIETAKLLATAVGVKGTVQIPGIGPDDKIGPLHRRLKRVSGDLMIVGHLPFLDRLMAKLVTGSSSDILVNFTTSSIVALANDDGEWQIKWMMSPEALRKRGTTRSITRVRPAADEATAITAPL